MPDPISLTAHDDHGPVVVEIIGDPVVTMKGLPLTIPYTELTLTERRSYDQVIDALYDDPWYDDAEGVIRSSYDHETGYEAQADAEVVEILYTDNSPTVMVTVRLVNMRTGNVIGEFTVELDEQEGLTVDDAVEILGFTEDNEGQLWDWNNDLVTKSIEDLDLEVL